MGRNADWPLLGRPSRKAPDRVACGMPARARTRDAALASPRRCVDMSARTLDRRDRAVLAPSTGTALADAERKTNKPARRPQRSHARSSTHERAGTCRGREPRAGRDGGRRRWIAVALAGMLAASAAPARADDLRPDDWPLATRDGSATRYSELDADQRSATCAILRPGVLDVARRRARPGGRARSSSATRCTWSTPYPELRVRARPDEARRPR